MRNSFLAFLAGVLLLPVALLLSGWWSVRADVVPSAFEAWLAKRATDASVRRQATPLTNPIAATPDELRAGLRVFRNNCAGCHGDGYEASAWGEEFYPPVPQFGRNPPRWTRSPLRWTPRGMRLRRRRRDLSAPGVQAVGLEACVPQRPVTTFYRTTEPADDPPEAA
jgi:mono/diheme cytochrome c family protein